MTAHAMSDAFRHHVWATVRLLDACTELDDDQLAATVPGTYGSIIGTLRHLVGGDVFYLGVLRGGEPEGFAEESSDLGTLRSVMEAHNSAWQEVLDRESDPTTDVVEHEDSGYETHAPLGIRLAQALYHGTDHRSQVCTALTTLGLKPPSIEPWDLAQAEGRMFTVDSTIGGEQASGT